jgi:hypothetical protein
MRRLPLSSLRSRFEVDRVQASAGQGNRAIILPEEWEDRYD